MRLGFSYSFLQFVRTKRMHIHVIHVNIEIVDDGKILANVKEKFISNNSFNLSATK